MLNYLKKKIPDHLWVAASGWFSRILIGLVQLISIPIFYQKLGLADFAVFTVITGLTAWYSLLDFGVGAAMQNYISEYRAQEKDPKELLTSFFPIVILLLVFVGFIIFILGSMLEKWLFSHLPNNLSAFNFCMTVTFFSFYFILLIGNKILFAYRKGFLGYFYQSIGYLILLISMLLIQYSHISLTLSESLYFWVIPLLFSSIVMFIHAYYQAGANLKMFSWNPSFYKKLLGSSGKFWFVAFSANGVLAIDYLIIVKLLSATDIVTYNMINKIFMMMLFVYSAVLMALWPVLAEAYAKKTIQSYQDAELEIRRSIIAGLIYMTLATLLLIIFRQAITHIFKVQQAISLPVGVLILFGFYGCIRVFLDTYTTALQARNKIKLFIWGTPAQALIAIPSMIYLSRFGLIGVLGALVFSFLIFPLWIVPYMHYHYKNDDVKHGRIT